MPVLEDMPQDAVTAVLNPSRLKALRDLGLLDTPAEAAFDGLGELASKFLRVPIAMVTLVDENRQFLKSCLGLPEPWASWRQTPLSHSFCQHVVNSAQPLVISDARQNPLVRDNPAVTDLGVIAYLGIPLKLRTGEVLGSFCVIDHVPRLWSSEEISILSSLTRCAITEIELRSEIAHARAANAQIAKLNTVLAEKAAELAEKIKEIELFSYTVSHDLRGPLSRIGMFAELLQPAPGEQSQFVANIQRNVREALDVTEGVLRLCGLSRKQFHRERVDLSEMADDILLDLRVRDPHRVANVQIQPGLKALADPQLVRLALENLLSNAWKFTATKPQAVIEFRGERRDNEMLFVVRDNGIGFSQEQALHIFQPFARVHARNEYSGLGIGLGTVKAVIELHGGRVWGEGFPGQGAQFYFALPDEPTPPSRQPTAQ